MLLLIIALCLIAPAAASGSPRSASRSPAANPITTQSGYWAHPFYEGLTYPTSLCFGPDGTLYVGGLDSKVKALQDRNGDGVADTSIVVASQYSYPLGLAVSASGKLYVSSRDLLSCPVDTTQDLVADYVDTLFTGFPIGLHQNSGICFGPFGNLFVTSGSSSNQGDQPYLAASILRFTPDGTFMDVYSTGHRNPYDLTFVNGVLFATDNSVSGDSTFTCWMAPDEVNRVVYGEDYGFPNCFGAGDCADVSEFCAQPCGVGDCERGTGCAGSIYPYVYLDPHSAPTGICTGEGFSGFDPSDVFVALWGQTEPAADCPTNFGHKVVWFDTEAQLGRPVEDFATGFLSPIDLAVGPDSALYVADFDRGTVYRIVKTAATGVHDDPPGPALTVRASPNPARGRTRLHWSAPEGAASRVRIYDIEGRVVADLPRARPGLVWDMTNTAGRRVAPGMYWVRVSAASRQGAQKLLVLD